MRSVARRLFLVWAALSVVLCASVCALWVRSYHVADALSWQDQSVVLAAGIERGSVLLYRVSSGNLTPHGIQHNAHPPVEVDDDFVALGFSSQPLMNFRYEAGPGVSSRGVRVAGVTVQALAFPLWLAFTLTALAPTLWLITYARRRDRTRRGLCAHCGYDLRAGPDRCPECGTTPAAK